MKFNKFQSELDDSHSKIAKLERIVTELKEDGERLAKKWQGEWNADGEDFQCVFCSTWQAYDVGSRSEKHASDCPVELHHQMLKKIEEEEK